jgi:alkylation response protein AidB-like acyl-CoA dehydrogenase
MDLDWSEEQLELRAETVAFARAKLNHDVEGDDRAGRFPTEKWNELAGWGFFRLAVPEELGGAGLDPMTALLVTEGLGEGCSDGGLVFSAVVQSWVIVPVLLRFGTEQQKSRYLPGLMAGSTIGALAMTESDTGSDAFAMRTRAERVDDGRWRLDGSKTYTTNGPVADLIVCFARTGAGGSMGGTSAFLLQTDQEGVVLGSARLLSVAYGYRPMPCSGARGSVWGYSMKRWSGSDPSPWHRMWACSLGNSRMPAVMHGSVRRSGVESPASKPLPIPSSR